MQSVLRNEINFMFVHPKPLSVLQVLCRIQSCFRTTNRLEMKRYHILKASLSIFDFSNCKKSYIPHSNKYLLNRQKCYHLPKQYILFNVLVKFYFDVVIFSESNLSGVFICELKVAQPLCEFNCIFLLSEISHQSFSRLLLRVKNLAIFYYYIEECQSSNYKITPSSADNVK